MKVWVNVSIGNKPPRYETAFLISSWGEFPNFMVVRFDNATNTSNVHYSRVKRTDPTDKYE